MSKLDNLVEATVTAFSFDREKKELRIDVSTVFPNEEGKAIVASGIDDFLIDDLRPYNIIDHVTLFGAKDAMEGITHCASSLFFLMQKRELKASDLEWPPLKQKLALIRSGALYLMEIEPVCGASALVLGEEIRIEAITD